MIKVPKFLLFVLIFLFGSLYSRAQFILPKVLAFGNFTYANPGGDFKNLYNNGTGFEVGGGIGLGKTILMASTGNIRYKASGSNTLGDLKVTPVKIGIRRYLLLGLFVNADAGLAFQNYDKTGASGGNDFLYEVGAGLKLLGIVEVGAAYTGWKMAGTSTNANSLLLKAGLAIKI